LLESSEERLTRRETEILRLLALGNNHHEIAKKLFISVKTIDTHRSNLLRKLKLRNNADIARFAIRNGLIDAGGEGAGSRAAPASPFQLGGLAEVYVSTDEAVNPGRRFRRGDPKFTPEPHGLAPVGRVAGVRVIRVKGLKTHQIACPGPPEVAAEMAYGRHV